MHLTMITDGLLIAVSRCVCFAQKFIVFNLYVLSFVRHCNTQSESVVAIKRKTKVFLQFRHL